MEYKVYKVQRVQPVEEQLVNAVQRVKPERLVLLGKDSDLLVILIHWEIF